jgi:hypothetical protein
MQILILPYFGGRRRRGLALFTASVLFFSSLIWTPGGVPSAEASGTPDIAPTLAYDAETLYGSTADVTLTASNAGGPDSYNLTFNTSVGSGMSLSGFSLSPTQVIADAPVLGDTTYICKTQPIFRPEATSPSRIWSFTLQGHLR